MARNNKSGQNEQHATLSQLHGNVVLPSTLGYRERTQLRQKEAFEYSRIYNHAATRGLSVYDRLTADAAVRQTLKCVQAPAQQDRSSFAAMVATASTTAAAARAAGMCSSSDNAAKPISGFVSNNNLRLTCKQQSAEAACTTQPPLSALHPITLRSYYKKFPVDMLAAARPQARTTNETLRMMGTYTTDTAIAQRLGLHIPHGCSSTGAAPGKSTV